ncbi:NHLP bacteriocin export ABC transporter permease/ATPase subunit [Altericista sp. CCNU0014]|uniref:NHLP bacteriocin export ABC transporter permease/ATPase subunit n=1 Tax=Altericista sp. CCNU0014 TaxID=3082949 RepID=UPI00384F5481
MPQDLDRSSSENTGLPTVLKLNQALVLATQQVWRVEMGELSLFSVVLKDGEPSGNRRFLCTVRTGELFCGVPPTPGRQQLVLMAIAATTAKVVQILADELAIQLKQGADLLLAGIEGWVEKLGQFAAPLAQTVLQCAPTLALQTQGQGESHFSLKRGQSLQARRGSVVWLQVQRGSLAWSGLPELTLLDADSWFPLSGLWVEALEPTELQVISSRELPDAETLLTGLFQMLSYFLDFVEQLEQQEQLEAYIRFRERKRLSLESLDHTLEELADVLNPGMREALREGSPLAIAARAVGQSLGASIAEPAKSENLKRLKVPLEAIARASRLRMRRVLLRGNWWKQDVGALVAFRAADEQPVALLPSHEGQYRLLDPMEQGSRPLTQRLAETLSPIAYTLYRALPARQLQAADLLKFTLGKRVKDLWMIAFSAVAATLLGMVIPQATAILINDAIPDADRGLLMQIGLALIATTIGTMLFRMAQTLATLRLETLAEADTSAAIWDRLLNVEVPFLRQYATGDLELRVSAIDQIRRRLTGTTLQTILSSFFSVLNLGLLFYYSPPLASIALVVAFLSIAFTTTIGVLIFKLVRRLQTLQGEIAGFIVELISGIAKLRVAGAEARAFSHWGKQYAQQQRLSLQQETLGDGLMLFNEVLPIFSTAILFWIASAQLATEQLSIGTFLAFNIAFGSFVGGATSLSNSLLTLLEVSILWERAKPILEAKLEVDDTKADPGRLTGRVALDHISFRYQEEGALILDNVSIEAEQGEFIALVGPSGSGKSTILRLLLGFEIPQSGKIAFDGQDLAGLNLQAVRRQIGVVMQNGKLTAGTILDNIAAGALLSMDEAWQAARNAGLEADIRTFPMGMHTTISEGGGNLSGGQRQRLLIARSLALQPRILLFDEATSALDNHTQAIVSSSLEKLHVTRILIAHRLSTIRHADRIYVLKAGRVVEKGTFEELMQKSGVFKQLMATQQL